MSLTLKPYPEYRESGLPWVGKLPHGWNKERAKWLFQRMQRPVRSEDGVVTCFRDGMVTLRSNRRLDGFTESLKEIGYQGVRRGDLVIHAMDAFAGAIGVADSDGKSTPVYSVCSPRTALNAHYYANVVREMARSQWIAALAKGIRERSTDFRYEAFANEWLPFPSVDEQNAIASFIQRIDSKTRKLIRAKRRVIELLNEQKQAIILRAATRGLDPNVRLEPSGIEWIGEIPKHWQVMPVRRLISYITSGSRGWAEFYSDEGDMFLQSGNLGRDMALNLESVQRVQLPPSAEGQRTRVRMNDLLICITGALTGNVILVDDELPCAYVNQHVALFRPNQNQVISKYLCYALHSELGAAQLKQGEYGGTKQGLGLDEVKNVLVLFPSIAEQEEIVRALDRELGKLRASIGRVNAEISLLREYRIRLIADVVTGKLDVRGVELTELDEVEEVSDVVEEELEDSAELVAVEENVDAD